MTLTLEPPPRTLPIFRGMERPLRRGLGWSTKALIAFAPQIRGPLDRFHDIGYIVRAARFKQQYANIGILSQPTRYHRARGA